MTYKNQLLNTNTRIGYVLCDEDNHYLCNVDNAMSCPTIATSSNILKADVFDTIDEAMEIARRYCGSPHPEFPKPVKVRITYTVKLI